jgi:hypothetical protein
VKTYHVIIEEDQALRFLTVKASEPTGVATAVAHWYNLHGQPSALQGARFRYDTCPGESCCEPPRIDFESPSPVEDLVDLLQKLNCDHWGCMAVALGSTVERLNARYAIRPLLDTAKMTEEAAAAYRSIDCGTGLHTQHTS